MAGVADSDTLLAANCMYDLLLVSLPITDEDVPITGRVMSLSFKNSIAQLPLTVKKGEEGIREPINRSWNKEYP